MEWENKRVFITGATGFIGSHLAETLVREHAEVVVPIRDIVPKSYFYLSGTDKKVIKVTGQLQDYPFLLRCLHDYEIEYCFHLAAQAIVPIANRTPVQTFESNILGTWNMLEAARNAETVKGIIVASSDKAYGTHKKLPYTEECPLAGRYPYDASKACADILAQSYYYTYNLPVVISRLGNVYGPGDLNFSRIIPSTILSVIRNQPPQIRSDGTPKRDYFYIKDAVSAYTTLGDNLDKRKIYGQAFNFGTETPVKVIDVVNLILKIMKTQNLKPKILNKSKGEILEQYLSCKKAREILSWESHYTLERGLSETIPWYENFLKQ